MIEIRKWLDDTSEWLFEYALDYFNEVEFPITPKLHTIDANNRVAVIDCKTWEANDIVSYEVIGEALDGLIDSIDAVAYTFLFVAKVNNIEGICIIGNSRSIKEPIFYYKQIIRYIGGMDFGPLESMSYKNIKSLELEF
jgi:hypothetical protein